MKITELRLDNLVQGGRVVVIHRTYVALRENDKVTHCKIEDLNPIPLTEEWLLKFGFVEYKTEDKHHTFAKRSFNWNDGVLYVIGHGYINHIKYVNQLQNLFFALTGEELTIKES
jgi:hypothetical protein